MELGFNLVGFKEEATTHMHISMVGIESLDDGLGMVEIADGLIHIGKIDNLVDIEDKVYVKNKNSVYNKEDKKINLSGGQQNKIVQ